MAEEVEPMSAVEKIVRLGESSDVPSPKPPERGHRHEAGVVASSVYAHGVRIADISVEEAGEWARKDGHVVWIGLLEPDDALLACVQRQFALHPLAVEDAANAHQRPKLEQYGDALFVVARTAQMVDKRIAFGETHIFVGNGYIVSVRHGASTSYKTVRQHWETCPTSLAKGEDFILYAILDFIVDNYMPVLESIHEEVEAFEDKVLERPMGRADIERLYTLRRDLLRLRNAVGPLVDVCQRLANASVPQVRPTLAPMFRDVTDHVRTVQEKIDSLREVLAFAFEASLLVGQSQENAIFKKLAAWAAILAVPTAIAGVYGMNFKNMPELELQFGYHAVLAVIVTSCAVLYWRFRKNGWL
jgi:magnesium transporter